MGTHEFLTIGLAVLSPVLATLLGIVGLVIGDWRQRRSDEGRRKLAFDDGSMQVAFATEWYEATKKLTDDQDTHLEASTRAQTWLEEAAQRVERSAPPPTEAEQPTVTLRRLLLGYPLERPAARRYRAAMYVTTGFLFLAVAGAIDSAFRPDTVGASTYFFGIYFYSDIAGILLLTVIAVLFRYLAVHAEAVADHPHQRMTLGRALLWYRFERPDAKLVRVVFWISAALTVFWAGSLVVAFDDDPRSIPLGVCWFLVSLGYTVGFRRWAAWRESRGQ